MFERLNFWLAGGTILVFLVLVVYQIFKRRQGGKIEIPPITWVK